VDVKVGSAAGTPVFADVEFREITDYVEVDPGTYTFVITAAGGDTAVVSFDQQELLDGEVLTVVALGTLDDTDAVPFTVRVFVDTGDGSASLDLAPVI